MCKRILAHNAGCYACALASGAGAPSRRRQVLRARIISVVLPSAPTRSMLCRKHFRFAGLDAPLVPCSIGISTILQIILSPAQPTHMITARWVHTPSMHICGGSTTGTHIAEHAALHSMRCALPLKQHLPMACQK